MLRYFLLLAFFAAGAIAAMSSSGGGSCASARQGLTAIPKQTIVILIEMLTSSRCCPGRDSSCYVSNGPNSYSRRHCYCDEGCLETGDCCSDYKEVCAVRGRIYVKRFPKRIFY